MKPVTDLHQLSGTLSTVLKEAAKPFVLSAQFALLRRGTIKDREAAGRVAQLKGPHANSFSALGTVSSLPAGLTYRHVKRMVATPTFRAIAQELIAAVIADAPEHEKRLRDALYRRLLDLYSD